MDQGYVKLWRKIIESQVFKNEGLLKVWIWCLVKASYRERIIGFQTGKAGIEVKIEPGQFVFGKYSAAKDLKMNPSTVWKRINKLKNIGNLDLKSNQQYTLVSIINWETYQEKIIESSLKSNHQVTTKEPASRPNNKVKKEKNKEHSADFQVFYKAYPNKKDPDDAWRAWTKRNGDRPELDRILAAIERQIAWRKTAKPGEFRPEWKNPATWLSKGSWADEVQIEEKIIDPVEQERIQKLENRRNGLS